MHSWTRDNDPAIPTDFDIPAIIRSAFEETCNPHIAVNAFNACGIWCVVTGGPNRGMIRFEENGSSDDNGGGNDGNGGGGNHGGGDGYGGGGGNDGNDDDGGNGGGGDGYGGGGGG
ncbi:unnamed protein product, partial [Allacma fusca]